MPNGQYDTLQAFMEGTSTSGDQLLERANAKLRGEQKMSRSLLSMILSGSRRCSGEKAWALHQVTGVPMDELTRWPRYAKTRKSRSAA